MGFFEKLELKGLYFNEMQKNAIAHVNGPLLVAAGPGSGKTSVITARTAYLIQKECINPDNILVITFTRAAANDMKLKFRNFPGITLEHIKKADFGTFHSTFYKIINTYYGRHFPVLEAAKTYSIFKSILRSLSQPFDDEIIQNVQNEISMARTTVEHINDFVSQSFTRAKFISIYTQYESFKHSVKCIDFDDMMIMCKKVLETDEKALAYYRQKYKYLLVDEFQDTNQMQFDIIKLICPPNNNIFVVGDDDQSIYGFRGAIPNCFTDFKQFYNPCSTIVLDINYRSTQEIIDISKKVISNNTGRIEKDLKSHRGIGQIPTCVFPPDEVEESSFIGDTIQELKKQGYSYSDFAVLYRVNLQSRPVIDELIKRNIPFNIKDGLNNFFNHWVSRDITCYLKLSMNTNDLSSLAQIVNRPVRYIPKDCIDNAFSNYLPGRSTILELFENSDLKEFQKQHLRDLLHNINMIKSMQPSFAVNFIRKFVGYDKYVRNYCMDCGIDYDGLYEILGEYEVSASGFNTVSSFLSHIHEVSIILKKDKTNFLYKKDSMTLSTIHGAKGLEFPVVFVIGLIENFLPHKKSVKTGENIEEERRLFYVAVTRAKDRLFISSPKNHHNKSARLSRFLTEALNDDNLHNNRYAGINTFKIGELISHKVFGTGKILDIVRNTAEIQFNRRLGKNKLDLDTCIENKLLEK